MTAHPSRFRRTFFAVTKIVFAAALLAYLLRQAQRHDAFTQLVEQPKQWSLLAAGLVCTFVSVTLGFVRWHLFIHAAGISHRLLDSLRLGALGFAFNFVSLGSIGGDFFKAIFLAHGQPGKRTESVATVVADRILGVTTILVLASGSILATNLQEGAPASLIVLCDTVLAAAAVALVGIAFALAVPGLSGPRAVRLAQSVPLFGSTIARILGTIHTYRNRKRVLLAAAGISVAGNLANITAFYLVASGLPIQHPTYVEHLVLVPVANMVGSIPATPNGLGTKEAAADLLYRTMPSGPDIAEGVGAMVTLAHRVTEMAVALLGLAYYLGHRKEVREVYEEAEEVAELGG